MRSFTTVVMLLIALIVYLVGYFIFADVWVSLAMLICFWIGAILAVVMED